MTSRATKTRNTGHYLNNFEMVSVFRAFDGTKFYGDQDGENKCKDYNDTLIDKLEEEMIGNIIIYNTSYFFEGLRPAYIKFITPVGKQQFITWCKYNYIDLKYKDNINDILELNKWYEVHRDSDIYYSLNTTDLDEIINTLTELKKKLDAIDDTVTMVL